MTSRFQIFTDGSDLDGVAHPREIRHIRYVRYLLLFTSAWPQRAAGEHKTTLAVIYGYVNLLVATVACLSFITYVWNHVGILSFFDLGHSFILVMMSTVWAINLYVHKLSHVYCIYLIGQMFWGLTLFNVIPLYNNAQVGGYRRPAPANVMYEHPLYLALPFDYQHTLGKGYMVAFILDWYISITISFMFSLLDVMLTFQMFHLWGHLKILIHNLENFPRPVARLDRYSDEELKNVRQRLKEIVEHHNLILQHSNTVSATFGPTIAVYYAFHQISGCVLLYECSTLEPKVLMRFGPLTLIMLQLQVQMSVVFELVSAMTDRVIRAAYSLPWELMDIANRRSTLIIMAQSQRPLGIKAVGIVEVGMKTTVTILKTTLSYFLMLLTMAKDQEEDATS